MADWPIAKVAAPEGESYDDYVMVCLRPDVDFRDRYASMRVANEEADDMHITLGYFGKIGEDLQPEDRERITRACYATALLTHRKVTGKINGYGWFLNDDQHVLVALWDIPYIAELRERLMRRCKDHLVPLREENHGFTPHMTLAYEDQSDYTIPESFPTGGQEEVTFEEIWLVWGTEWISIPLT